MNPIGEPDAGDRHVRFDERGWETGDWQSLKHRAHPRLHPSQADAHDGEEEQPLTVLKAQASLAIAPRRANSSAPSSTEPNRRLRKSRT